MTLSRDAVLLFYREPERDRFLPGDRFVRRAVRPLVRRLRNGQAVSGFGVWFRSLVAALRGAGVEVHVDDHAAAEANPGHPVGLVGAPEILDGWTLPNPIVLGPGMFDHPAQRPALLADARIRRYLVTCEWMERLFRAHYGEVVARWYGAIDSHEWPDRSWDRKDVDVLVYDKIRWDRERWEPELLEPALQYLDQHGLSHRVLRYGHYGHEEYRALLGRVRSLLFLCEHETQGMAYQEALASNVPVLAWDPGVWMDPRRAEWQATPVPATSVPFFSEECGERFRGGADFDAVADRFFGKLDSFRPRQFVLRELSPAGSAAQYLEPYRQAAHAEPGAPTRVHIGSVGIDPVRLGSALDAIEHLVEAGKGGAVYTPNVDHVVNAERSPAFRSAYAEADLSLVDGTPLLWASRLLGTPLPEKVSGSDLLEPLVARAAARGWRVFLTGGGPGVAAKAAKALRRRYPGLQVVGVDCPRISSPPGLADEADLAACRVAVAHADLVLVGFGSPKQELWIHQEREILGRSVAVAVGAGLDFAAGTAHRAPRWVSRSGLEWAYRLGQEPRRLWRRYLLNDPRFVGILGAGLWHAALPAGR